jgi:copper homeostasis protein
MLEIIAKNIDDVIQINKSKANRIEFCINLENGGLTPKIDDIVEAAKISKLPIMVMLREHYDNFEITNQQLSLLMEKLKKINKINIKGIVFGALDNKKVNKKALVLIKSNVQTLEITFHKAFDYVDNFYEEAKYLKSQQINRVLTSGGIGDPLKNIDNLLQIKKSKIEVLVGGGVNIKNINQLVCYGFKNFHLGTAVRQNKN